MVSTKGWCLGLCSTSSVLFDLAEELNGVILMSDDFYFSERKTRNPCKQVADANKMFFNVLCKLALSSGVLCLETPTDG